MRTRVLIISFGLLISLSGGQSALASTIFNQEPRDESLNGPILNYPYLVMFNCPPNYLSGCKEIYGKTVYNIGIWIKKVGNPADIMLQVVDTFNHYPVANMASSSNPVSAKSISSTAYKLKWFYFPNGVVLSSTKQLFMPQFAGAINTSNRTDHYQALYDPVNSYNAPMQWCKVYLGCWSSKFFWRADDTNIDLSLPPPPSITLLGSATTTVELGATFTDPGATAHDNIDGDITNAIHVIGSVDTGVMGTTTLTYSITNSHGLTASTTRAVVVACAHNCNSNVLFLPGIEASRLYRPDYAGGTDQLWEPNIENDVKDLFLTAVGTSVRDDVYTKDVIDEKNVLPVGQGNIYKSFLNDLKKWKNTDHLITDYAAVPYDWRLSFDDILNNGNKFPDGRIYYAGSLAATSSPYIIQELRRLAKSSKTGKVTIVAHSNGGLLTKALTEKLGSTEAAKLIDKVIFVAVPQAGTPQAIGAILHGYDQGLPFDSLPLILTPETARALAVNMPSAYNLLPSASYFTHVDNPVVEFDDSDFLAEWRAQYGSAIHDGAQLKKFIAGTWRLASSSPSDLKYPIVGNAALLSRAETLHSTIDTWAPPQGVLLYEVAGWGEDTLAAIEYKEGKKAYCSDMSDPRTCTVSPAITYSPKEVVEGDGTVLVPSALWTAASTGVQKYWVNLKKYDELLRGNIERNHADILEIPDLRILVKNILTNTTSPSYTFITTTQPATGAGDNKRLRFLLHSPLDLSATDSLGNVVSSATSTIPGARWKRYGEVQVLTVPQNTPVTLRLDGYAPGSFTLDIEEVDGGNTITASSTLSAIPSTSDTQATMVFADGTLQNASPLLVDYDGNGSTDFSLESVPGEEVVFDTTPPEATLSFNPASQELEIIGTDNLSRTTVLTTATSSLITDEAGNTLQIIFEKFKQKGKEIKIEIQGLRYNGVFTGETSKTVLQYEWSTDRAGTLKELEEEATTGLETVRGHYSAKKNVTKIEEKTKGRGEKNEKEEKKTLSGLVIVGLTIDRGRVDINY